MLDLDSLVQYVPYVGPGYAKRLEKLNIITTYDLLMHLPSRYDDFTNVTSISDLNAGEIAAVKGELTQIKNQYTKGGFVLQKGTVKDDTGELDLMWFNQPFLIKSFKKGETYAFLGKVEQNGRKLVIKSPKVGAGSGFEPVYPETAGVSSKFIRNRISYLLKTVDIPDPYFYEIPLKAAFQMVHFPKNYDEVAAGRKKLAFDEMLLFTLLSKKRKREWQETILGHKLEISSHRNVLKTYIEKLPFTLTKAQNKVIGEIYEDLAKSKPMNRLLQGDVGSGKTVVAAAAMLCTYLNGYKTILMAPTEILAQQHYQTVSQMLDPLNIKVGIATGSQKINTDYDILVGTHALLNLDLNNLGLVVIDEQHRFGVEQRAKLIQKTGGSMPHTLTMTATPIPRTIALTALGDLDISIIDEMPVGRLPVKTWVVPDEKRAKAYEWIREQKTQTFIICPFIEPSETLETVKSAKTEYEKIKNVFSELRVGLLHGRQKPKEKNAVLNDFKDRKLDILVATPVVEVGVDVPGATIMVIEDADRFGLAQLHQLRGRVGRNDRQSYCLLFTLTPDSRLKTLEKTTSGLELAEADLKFRGPGELFGTAQSGKFVSKVITFDPQVILASSQVADEVYQDLDQFPLLKKKLEKSTIAKVLPN